MMPNFFKHAANLPVSALDQRYFIPRIRRVFNEADLCGRGVDRLRVSSTSLLSWRWPKANATAQLAQVFFIGPAADLHQVSLGHVRCSASELVGQFTIIGEQEQAFTGIVQAAHRINPR